MESERKSSLLSFYRSELKSIFRQVRHDMHFSRSLRRGVKARGHDLGSLPFEFEFLVSSDTGLHHVSPSGMRTLLPIPMYGITLTDDFMFIAAQVYKRSILVRFERHSDDLYDMRNPEILHELMASTTNGRVHQINHGAGHVWVSNTERNSILKLNAGTGRIISEIWPLTDQFGKCMIGDHNHINSVHAFGDSIVFTAYAAGDHSLVGVIDGKMNVTGFQYVNMGVHDIYFEPDNFYFCDTFGSFEDLEHGGTLVTRHGPHPSEVFAEQPGYIPRGVVKSGSQLVVGNSHKGTRVTRFKGKGSLLLFQDDVFHAEIEMPCSQIYQLIRTDGLNVDASGDELKFDDMLRMLEECLGPPVYSSPAFVQDSCKVFTEKPLRLWRTSIG